MMSWSSSCFSFLLRTGRSLAAGVVCSDVIGPEEVLQDTGCRREALFNLQDSKITEQWVNAKHNMVLKSDRSNQINKR